jgi:hypothetical protein
MEKPPVKEKVIFPSVLTRRLPPSLALIDILSYRPFLIHFMAVNIFHLNNQ